MKKFLFVFLMGAFAGAGGYWYFTGRPSPDLSGAGDKLKSEAGRVTGAIQSKLEEISSEDIQQELARTGTVVREKARKAGEVIADATGDARITGTIKAKLLKEPGLSSLKIHVETTDGLVTLSGAVSSHDDIARAVRLALETEGVSKVISTLQVKPGT